MEELFHPGIGAPPYEGKEISKSTDIRTVQWLAELPDLKTFVNEFVFLHAHPGITLGEADEIAEKIFYILEATGEKQ